jgi:hypothetical protein
MPTVHFALHADGTKKKKACALEGNVNKVMLSKVTLSEQTIFLMHRHRTRVQIL